MHAADVRDLLIYCSDYKCSQWTTTRGDWWPHDVRLTDIEPPFRLDGMSVQTSTGAGGPTRDDVRTTHVGPDQTAIESEEWLTSEVAADSWRNKTDTAFPAARQKHHWGNGTGA
ncbi:hypothetical protein GALL_516000 [mine drainage metagenome]|uniref:Uncharacterized protein n=1 Tax=mine drainage metagenome TaxID=410659 RepID=A0A1J5PGY5_9ZZZZ